MAVTTVVGNDLFTIGPGQSIDYRYWWGANDNKEVALASVSPHLQRTLGGWEHYILPIRE